LKISTFGPKFGGVALDDGVGGVVGTGVGAFVGFTVGEFVGTGVGELVGFPVGEALGETVGAVGCGLALTPGVGVLVGAFVVFAVGEVVGAVDGSTGCRLALSPGVGDPAVGETVGDPDEMPGTVVAGTELLPPQPLLATAPSTAAMQAIRFQKLPLMRTILRTTYQDKSKSPSPNDEWPFSEVSPALQEESCINYIGNCKDSPLPLVSRRRRSPHRVSGRGC
jgi:hypothetical protein